MLVSFRASRRRVEESHSLPTESVVIPSERQRVEESHSLPTEIPPSGRFEIPRLRRRFARASLGMTHSSGRRFARAPLGMTKFLESPSARSE
jgi:hypothetical protein